MMCAHGQHILRVCFQGEPQHCVGAFQNIKQAFGVEKNKRELFSL
jgi:hypothetical protein